MLILSRCGLKNGSITITQNPRIIVTSQTAVVSDVMPLNFFSVLRRLCDLQSASYEAWERTCKRLDKKFKGKGDFVDVARAFNVDEEDIFEFEKELRHGSPSKQLLEYLAATQPWLSVLEFVKVLRLPRISREDVVEILERYPIVELNGM